MRGIAGWGGALLCLGLSVSARADEARPPVEAAAGAAPAPDVAKAPSDKAAPEVVPPAPAPEVVPPPAPAPEVVPPPADARPDAQETRDPALRRDDIAPLPPPPPGRFGPAQTLGGSSLPFGDPVGESPQRFAVELKFGPYVPAIDSSVGLSGRTPFQDLFGVKPGDVTSGWRVLSQLEFDYQLLRVFGTLGVGLSVGYYRISAPQLVYADILDANGVPVKDAAGNRIKTVCSNSAACFSGDENHFNLVPLEALLVYRFDHLARRFRIPIIPYIKGGFAYYIWWNGTSGSFVANQRYDRQPDGTYKERALADQPQVSGASSGLAVHPGLAIDLGVIDRQAARVMDRELGVNRVSLFAELNYAWVTNFNIGTKLNLSNTTFNVGLLMEF